jgi:hypothetical protein
MNVYNDVIEIYVNGSHATTIDDDFIYEYLCKHSPESVRTDDDEIEYVLVDEHRIDYLELIKRKDDYIRTLQDNYDKIFNQLGDKNLVDEEYDVDEDAGYDAYKEELAGMNDYIKEKDNG